MGAAVGRSSSYSPVRGQQRAQLQGELVRAAQRNPRHQRLQSDVVISSAGCSPAGPASPSGGGDGGGGSKQRQLLYLQAKLAKLKELADLSGASNRR